MVMVMYMEGSMWYLKVCHMLAAAEVRERVCYGYTLKP